MKTQTRIIAAVGACALAAAFSANAAIINSCGPNVCYEYESTQTATTLTGQPTRVGDSMEFLAPAFVATSSGGAGWITSGPANFIFSRVYTVSALDEITTFTVGEEFDYEIITGGEVRATLYTQARSNILATDGTSVSPPDFVATGDSAGNQINGITALLYPAFVFAGPASDMQVSIQNTLRAFTDSPGQLASIQKKFTLVTNTILSPEIVPVPAAIWLFGSGLGVVGLVRRRQAARL